MNSKKNAPNHRSYKDSDGPSTSPVVTPIGHPLPCARMVGSRILDDPCTLNILESPKTPGRISRVLVAPTIYLHHERPLSWRQLKRFGRVSGPHSGPHLVDRSRPPSFLVSHHQRLKRSADPPGFGGMEVGPAQKPPSVRLSPSTCCFSILRSPGPTGPGGDGPGPGAR